MENEKTTVKFDRNVADEYDTQRDKLSPIKDALHLCVQMLLTKLPSDANALIVGAGTGAELIFLAQAFPKWRFTVVEPSIEMLEICKKRTDEIGAKSRCFFHNGYLESLSRLRDYDFATSILVSHFFINPDDRVKYFSEIASRLRPDAYFVEASLASDMSKPEFMNMLKIWENMHEYAGIPFNTESFGTKVDMIPVERVGSLIESAGFDKPTLFFKSLFIHAWFTRVSSTDEQPNSTLQSTLKNSAAEL